MLRFQKIFYIVFLFSTFSFYAQDDLLSLVESKDEGPKKVYATFKTMRIGNAHTIETVKKHHLDYRISHRFGNVYNSDTKPDPVNEMFQNFLGLDGASDIRNSLDYGVLDNLTVGLGRSRMNKLADANIKWKFLEQTDNFSIPVSVAFFASTGYNTEPTKALYSGSDGTIKSNNLHRLNFFYELIIASKINSSISLELLPAYFYRNYILERYNPNNKSKDENGIFCLGFGGRIKLNKRLSFIGDYYYNFSKFYQNNSTIFNPLSLGFEIETGGHVFSLFFTNASGLIENNYLINTSDTWSKGQFKFGFTISRTFAL